MNENISLTTLTRPVSFSASLRNSCRSPSFDSRRSGKVVRPQCIRIEAQLLYAGGQGIEPRFFGPKPNVLPLDDPPLFNFHN